MKKTPNRLAVVIALGLISASAWPAAAAIINNGGFEAGFAGWTRVDEAGSDGTFFQQSGVLSPVAGDTVPPPPGGSNAAMTDALGPGSHVLYQDFVIPSPMASAILVFDLFIGNRAGEFRTPNTLSFSTPTLNQQARVDVLAGAADPFSLAPADVLLNAFGTTVGDPLVSGYTHFEIDITALVNANLNTPLRLRFAEVDNLFTFQFGVDNVDIVPEPTSAFMLLSGVLALMVRRRTIR